MASRNLARYRYLMPLSDDLARLPYWPQAMKRKTAAAYLDMSEAAFEREVLAGRLPQPIWLGGRDHWRRDAIDAALNNLMGPEPEPEWRREFRERYGPDSV